MNTNAMGSSCSLNRRRKNGDPDNGVIDEVSKSFLLEKKGKHVPAKILKRERASSKFTIFPAVP